uniref:Pollen-specific leucine-rich repeat extensin-like protein 1 n=1 Tax=Crassostrea virginica TaxID=6565 RepID=A0A8B8B9H1_CRAVI|nr:pollen-specific leucine-rich repeat extensin-like protein 1 [Crassostrea virginica]
MSTPEEIQQPAPPPPRGDQRPVVLLQVPECPSGDGPLLCPSPELQPAAAHQGKHQPALQHHPPSHHGPCGEQSAVPGRQPDPALIHPQRPQSATDLHPEQPAQPTVPVPEGRAADGGVVLQSSRSSLPPVTHHPGPGQERRSEGRAGEEVVLQQEEQEQEVIRGQQEEVIIRCHQECALLLVLNFIFGEETAGRYPSLKEISELPFFKNVNLVEMNKFNPSKIYLSKDMKKVIKIVNSGKPVKKKLKRSPSSAKTDTLVSKTTSDGGYKPPSPTPPGGPPVVSPPPPPPPPPPPVASPGGPPPAPQAPPPPPPSSGGSGARAALLGDIRTGMKLKKTVTNDRSAPKV